jgi:hypothetical protein
VPSFGSTRRIRFIGRVAPKPSSNTSANMKSRSSSAAWPTTGWNGDQGHHFAAFFELGYEYSVAGLSPGSLAAFVLEYVQGLDSGVMNVGDVNLGEAAAQIGAQLASKQISMSQVAGKIQGLCSK